MRFIRAQLSDWHPDNPNIRPSLWFVPVIAVILIVAAIAFAGYLVNGNGSPFLGGQ